MPGHIILTLFSYLGNSTNNTIPTHHILLKENSMVYGVNLLMLIDETWHGCCCWCWYRCWWCIFLFLISSWTEGGSVFHQLTHRSSPHLTKFKQLICLSLFAYASFDKCLLCLSSCLSHCLSLSVLPVCFCHLGFVSVRLIALPICLSVCMSFPCRCLLLWLCGSSSVFLWVHWCQFHHLYLYYSVCFYCFF